MITFVVGDLTTQEVDAIVNAANEALRPGGGVCGAIRRAGGDEIFAECAALGGCATGDAKATASGNAACPVRDPRRRPRLARRRRAASRISSPLPTAGRSRWRPGSAARTVAFPALSTGIYGYPPELAAAVALAAVEPLADRFEEIRFVFLDDELRALFERAASSS